MSDTVRQFGRWWIGQLRSLAQFGDGAAPGSLVDGVVLDVSDAGADVPQAARIGRRRAGRLEPLGTIPLGPGGSAPLRRALEAAGGRLVLRVPEGWLLHHEVVLPLAAERSLAPVLRHELGRVTPFDEAEIVWDHGVALRDAPRGRLVVFLVLGLRGVLDPVLEALAALGARPERIEPAGPGAPLRLRREDGGGGTGTRVLAAACAALAVAVLALPLVRQSLGLARAEGRIAALRPAVERAEALRRRIAGAGATGETVAAEAARVGSALATLATLTALLPDGTYLTTLTLQARRLTIEGRSTAAAGLIAALSADPVQPGPVQPGPILGGPVLGGPVPRGPVLRGVEFTAPVTHAEGGGDAFALRAQVGG